MDDTIDDDATAAKSVLPARTLALQVNEDMVVPPFPLQ
jgi:hypothetical protein